MKKTKISITLDKEVADNLAVEAEKDDRSKSSIINRMLRKLFKLDKIKPTAKGSE